MNKTKGLLVLLLCVLVFLAGCDSDAETEGAEYFEYDLRGTWKSNSPDFSGSGFDGTLVIDWDEITISGYSGHLDPSNESKRPFLGFTKGAALECYSVKGAELDYPDHEGTLHIKDAGLWQTGIQYVYYETGTYPVDKFLRINFGGRDEILKKVEP